MPVPRFVHKALTSVFLTAFALSLTPAIAQADSNIKNTTTDSTMSSMVLPKGEQRYIVKYNDNVDAEAESSALQDKGIEVKDTLSNIMKASVVVASKQEIDTLKASANVDTIEVDQRVSINGATSIWGVDRVDQRTGRDGQYNIGDEGGGVNVYVVDSGLNFSHTEFSGRVPISWSGIYDGNGANDCNGHGTHVAGTVAGTNYGIAKKANIIPLRVLECDGSGWSSTVVAALDWAVAHHPAGQPAVINMSIGGFTTASLDRAVRNAVDDGITVVAAAGNSNVDACTSAPASIAPAITVAATDINDAMASFSNYGSCVDIQAPGVSIRSAYNNAATGYNTMSGTSMAAPHVAGAAAVLLSRNRSMTPAEMHQTMINNATVGIIAGNKGATPNRMLFIPPLPTPVPCTNLKLGDAWAGVGTACNLQGRAAGEASVLPSTAESANVADAEASSEVPVPAIAPEPAPAKPITYPMPVVAPAEPPVAAPAPAAPEKISAPVEPIVTPAATLTSPPEISPSADIQKNALKTNGKAESGETPEVAVGKEVAAVPTNNIAPSSAHEVAVPDTEVKPTQPASTVQKQKVSAIDILKNVRSADVSEQENKSGEFFRIAFITVATAILFSILLMNFAKRKKSRS